eukprot:5581356-Prymnesium_polylepis.1
MPLTSHRQTDRESEGRDRTTHKFETLARRARRLLDVPDVQTSRRPDAARRPKPQGARVPRAHGVQARPGTRRPARRPDAQTCQTSRRPDGPDFQKD